jgi:alkaline phosphatase
MKNKTNMVRVMITLASLIIISCASVATQQKTHRADNLTIPKNIIILVGDGMGFNHLKAAGYYLEGNDRVHIFEQEDWVKYAMATYSAVISTRNNDTVYSTGYNPRLASTDAGYFSKDYTDSGAGGTSLSTGVKSYNGTIGLGLKGDTLVHMSQAAKALGKSTGVVSSVQLSHATPASFTAHNNHRNNYDQIARYMFFNTTTDVIMATGNPDFDEDGNPGAMNPQYVGGQEVWDMLKANDSRVVFETSIGTFHVKDANGDGTPDPWSVFQTREEFLKLASGKTPARVLGVPQVHSTLRQGRTKNPDHNMPFQTPINTSVPTLEEMTRAALNVLNQNPAGFFVMIEGGAIDWASHDNDSARMLEEQLDFINSVNAAVEWVEKNSNWQETLVIVTSDHECGYLTGPGNANPVYGPVVNTGKGNLPGMAWRYTNHTNFLVPFFAKGAGAESFHIVADEYDPVYGPFIQNTAIANMVFLWWGKPQPPNYRRSALSKENR